MAIVVIVLAGAVCRLPASDIVPSPFFPLQTRWIAELEAPLAAAPAFDREHVYVALRDGMVTAVRLVDGEVSWSTEYASRFSPAVSDGVLAVATAQILVGIRSADGLTLWTSDVGATISAPPVLKSGWVVIVLESGDIVALRAEDGTEIWRRHLSGTLRVEPTVSGPHVFIPVADGRVVALDIVTGAPIWEHTVGGSPQEILAAGDLFVGSTDNFFYRLSRDDGSWLWRWRTGGDIVGRPAADASQVLFVSLDNVLRALDKKSGVQQWRRPLPGRPTAGPTIVGELALVAGVTPEILAFDTKTGFPAGTLKGPAEFAFPPYVIDPTSPEAPGVVAATGDGRLLAMLSPIGPPPLSIVFPPPPLLPEPERFAPADVLPFEPLPPQPERVAPADVLPFEPLPDVVPPNGDSRAEGARPRPF